VLFFGSKGRAIPKDHLLGQIDEGAQARSARVKTSRYLLLSYNVAITPLSKTYAQT
jgi:hypothetical protein